MYSRPTTSEQSNGTELSKVARRIYAGSAACQPSGWGAVRIASMEGNAMARKLATVKTSSTVHRLHFARFSRPSLITFSLLVVMGLASGFPAHAQERPDLEKVEQTMSRDGYVTQAEVRSLIRAIESDFGNDPRLSAKNEIQLQMMISEIESQYSSRMSIEARTEFQEFVARVGGVLKGPLQLPTKTVPYWQEVKGRLHNYMSTPEVPREVDVLVIGAGLTGASAAYHLSAAAEQGVSVAVVEAKNIASGASGSNGGNFELAPESFHTAAEHMVREREKFLLDAEPELSDTARKKKAFDQAMTLLKFGQENARIFKSIVKKENIKADVSDAGWLRIAENKIEEDGLKKDIALARSIGAEMELWSPERIKAETGIDAKFSGRMSPGYGNYHPYKFANAVFEVALKKGVQLYTQTSVLGIDSRTGLNEPVIVKTSRGEIRAKRVIVATDAYSANFIPELKMVAPYQSQVMTFEHVENKMSGMTITEKYGDLYYNGPKSTHYVDKDGKKRTTLLMGGGLDRYVEDTSDLKISREVYDLVKSQTDERFPTTKGQPASRIWTGAFGFTPDKFPILDYLVRDGKADSRIIAFVGSQGYGGSMCMLGGMITAKMAISPMEAHQVRKKLAPVELFTMKRFSSRSARGGMCRDLFVSVVR